MLAFGSRKKSHLLLSCAERTHLSPAMEGEENTLGSVYSFPADEDISIEPTRLSGAVLNSDSELMFNFHLRTEILRNNNIYCAVLDSACNTSLV